MQIEIYADSLLILHFGLNIYLLLLVNEMLYRTASLRRLVTGALLGSVAAVVPVLLTGMNRYGGRIGFVISVVVICRYTFRTGGLEQWIKVLEKMSVATLLLGSVLMILKRLLPPVYYMNGIMGVLGPGALGVILVLHRVRKSRQAKKECYVIVQRENEKIRIKALADTGNLLYEPISHRPVAVVDEPAFRLLFPENIPEWYRAIPFQSVGKKKGILKGYPLKSLMVEVGGMQMNCNDIYIAIGEEFVSREGGHQVILSPEIWEKKGEKKDDFENDFGGGDWRTVVDTQEGR